MWSNGHFLLLLIFLCVDVSYSIQTWLFCAWGVLQRIRWCKTLILIFGGGRCMAVCCKGFFVCFCVVFWFFSVLVLDSIRRFHFYSLDMLVKSIMQFSCSGVEMDQFCTVVSHDPYWCFKLESLVSKNYKFCTEEHILTRLAQKNRQKNAIFIWENNFEDTSLTHL